jgi:hypothetical protein
LPLSTNHYTRAVRALRLPLLSPANCEGLVKRDPERGFLVSFAGQGKSSSAAAIFQSNPDAEGCSAARRVAAPSIQKEGPYDACKRGKRRLAELVGRCRQRSLTLLACVSPESHPGRRVRLGTDRPRHLHYQWAIKTGVDGHTLNEFRDTSVWSTDRHKIPTVEASGNAWSRKVVDMFDELHRDNIKRLSRAFRGGSPITNDGQGRVRPSKAPRCRFQVGATRPMGSLHGKKARPSRDKLRGIRLIWQNLKDR